MFIRVNLWRKISARLKLGNFDPGHLEPSRRLPPLYTISVDSLFTLLGYIAACCTTFSFVPQLLHTFRTKSVEDLHVGTLLAFDVGITLWLIYGVYLHSWPMILANAVTLGFQIPLLIMKLRYSRRPKRGVQFEGETSR